MLLCGMLNRLLVRLTLLVVTMGLAGNASAQVSDEQVWQQFLKWLPSAPVSDNPGTLFSAYETKLTKNGTPAAEALRQRGVIMRQMRSHDDGWQVIFNNIYSSTQSGFDTRPNATLMQAIAGRTPGRALDAGMGQGRNSLYLALKGWDTTGFDVSDTGLAIALKNAAKAGVQLKAVQKSENDFDYGVSQWDLVLFCYVPFPVADGAYVDRLYRAVRPGGLVVIESFGSDAGSPGRRPVDLDPAVLRRAFGKFRILRLDDVMATPDWSSTKERVVKLVAEKER